MMLEQLLVLKIVTEQIVHKSHFKIGYYGHI